MGAFLSVNQASSHPPSLAHITFTSSPSSDKDELEIKSNNEEELRVGLVGKCVTFDSGGYSLKSAGGSMIELMKFDMGGAASIIG